jgi:cysteinyl-tRNA synthetase
MSVELLGEHFDIHGGGMDLKVPHHENEIAQTCAACGSKFVNVWMHNGFVRVDDEKMSKSLGNFFTVREVLEWVRDPEVVRYFMLASHYRGPINYTPESLAQADAALERLYLALRGVAPAEDAASTEATARFAAAMDDDFNTPIAVAELQSLARELNSAKAAGQVELAAARAAELVALGARLGVLRLEPEVFLRKRAAKQAVPATKGEGVATAALAGAEACAEVGVGTALSDADIDRLIDERAAARKARNFKESDRIRDQLAASGVLLEDQPGGRTLWRRG